MGLSSSSIPKSSASFVRERASHLESQPNTVYFMGEKIDIFDVNERKEQVVEMIVCKKATFGHWFIKLVIDANSEEPLEMHYYNCSAIRIEPRDKTKPPREPMKETRYAPEENNKLGRILLECLAFVKQKPYHLTSYNCQDFVTTIMSKFTNRKTNAVFNLPVLSRVSVYRPTKSKIMKLEKEFFQRCREKGLKQGLGDLAESNTNIKLFIARMKLRDQDETIDEDDERPLQIFVESVFTAEEDYRNSSLKKFFDEQRSETLQKIKNCMLESWRLASFLLLIEQGKWQIDGLLSPSEAYGQYQYILPSSFLISEATSGSSLKKRSSKEKTVHLNKREY